MKIKITLIAALMLMASVLKTEAQTIPNAGFESWTSFGTYSEPTGWSTYNSFSAGVITSEQGTPGSAGASYLKMTVKYVPAFSSLVGGVAISAPTLPMGNFVGGFPWSSRPANFTGKWQYKSTGTDSMLVEVLFTKWNAATMTSDVIGVGFEIMMGATVSSWTNFSIPVTYMDGTVPDSALIYLAAGVGSPASLVLNDYLYVDELAFSGTVAAGVDELPDAINMSLAPNPFSTHTNVTFREEQKNASITLVNVLGKVVRSFTFTGTELMLEKDELPAGIYFLNVTDNKISSTKKIVVQ